MFVVLNLVTPAKAPFNTFQDKYYIEVTSHPVQKVYS